MNLEERQKTFREAKILEILNHPGIIRFNEVYKTVTGQLCIVMDYADGGDLSQKIKLNKAANNFLKEDQIMNLFTQMLLAMKHVHDRKILHRDLKCGNIFLTE